MTVVKFILVILFVALIPFRLAYTKENPQQIITILNKQSLQIYDDVKQQYTKKTDPLIIAWSNRLSFYHKNKVYEFPFIVDSYRDLKAISHVILTTFPLFHPLNHFPDNIETVKQYRQKILDTLAIVDELPLNDNQKNRQKWILQSTYDFLTAAISKKSVTSIELNHFFMQLKPEIMRNIEDATRIQIMTLNEQMTKIQKMLTLDERSRLFVVVPGFKAPRQENVISQYFEKYLNVTIDSDRLIYAEGLTTTDEIMTLVGGWQLEANLSYAFFYNKDRMKKDLVADDASRYLKQCEIDTKGQKALMCRTFSS